MRVCACVRAHCPRGGEGAPDREGNGEAAKQLLLANPLNG